MIICSLCKQETPAPINYEAICFKCYNERLKNKGIRTREKKIEDNK